MKNMRKVCLNVFLRVALFYFMTDDIQSTKNRIEPIISNT